MNRIIVVSLTYYNITFVFFLIGVYMPGLEAYSEVLLMMAGILFSLGRKYGIVRVSSV